MLTLNFTGFCARLQTDELMVKYIVMTEQLVDKIASILCDGVDVPAVSAIEARYPSRDLSADAIVTRSAPSPTGFVHIGTIYMCLLNQFLARQSGGVYMLRVEDTDKKRELSDGVTQIIQALESFELVPDEGVRADSTSYGAYGPYLQSERKPTYLAYAVKLLKEGRAYPCFASKEELEENVKKQQAAKVRPGYYGQWAMWRDKSDADIEAALRAGLPFVLRFRSTGNHEKRIAVEDVLKGHIELPENDLDVPLIKADGSQLPTYHMAHVVDDHLMKSTIILRGDEWLPSTPLHIELAQALGVQPFTYAHFAPISVLDKNGGGKRKLSKRKDPEADVNFWLSAGYPIDGIKAYLLGLANSSFEEWYTTHPTSPLSDFTVTLEKLAASRAPLLDHNKLEDYCKDYFAKLPQDAFNAQIIAWAKANDSGFYQELAKDVAYTNEVLSIERGGDKPRKDLAKLSDASDQYLYFFDFSFDPLKLWDNSVEGYPFKGKNAEDIAQTKAAFLQTYNHTATKEEWFENMKKAAEAAGYALDNQAYKASPESFKGKIADFAQIIRYAVTLGKTRTPDLYAIMQIMGEPRVRQRLS